MNKDRRKVLARAIEDIEKLSVDIETFKAFYKEAKQYGYLVAAKLEDIKSAVETCRDEEQEAYENLSESLQGSDKGQAMEAAVQELEEAMSNIDSLCEALTLEVPEVETDAIITSIDEAMV